MQNLNEKKSFLAVASQPANTPSRRLKEALVSVARGMYSFVRVVEPTEAELMKGIQYLARAGLMWDSGRQGFNPFRKNWRSQ